MNMPPPRNPVLGLSWTFGGPLGHSLGRLSWSGKPKCLMLLDLLGRHPTACGIQWESNISVSGESDNQRKGAQTNLPRRTVALKNFIPNVSHRKEDWVLRFLMRTKFDPFLKSSVQGSEEGWEKNFRSSSNFLRPTERKSIRIGKPPLPNRPIAARHAPCLLFQQVEAGVQNQHPEDRERTGSIKVPSCCPRERSMDV